MKVITFNHNNRVILVAEDEDILSLESNHILHNIERIYGVTPDILTLHYNVTNVPEDFGSVKYTFDGTDWTPFNPT